jgi:hypothetical protein
MRTVTTLLIGALLVGLFDNGAGAAPLPLASQKPTPPPVVGVAAPTSLHKAASLDECLQHSLSVYRDDLCHTAFQPNSKIVAIVWDYTKPGNIPFYVCHSTIPSASCGGSPDYSTVFMTLEPGCWYVVAGDPQHRSPPSNTWCPLVLLGSRKPTPPPNNNPNQLLELVAPTNLRQPANLAECLTHALYGPNTYVHIEQKLCNDAFTAQNLQADPQHKLIVLIWEYPPKVIPVFFYLRTSGGGWADSQTGKVVGVGPLGTAAAGHAEGNCYYVTASTDFNPATTHTESPPSHRS